MHYFYSEIEPAKEKRLHKSHLMIISKILMQIATKWRFIGLALKFKDHELRNIQETPSTFRGGPPECLQIMLRKWLQRRSPKHDPPTQSALVGALGASTVGGDHLVKEIEEIQCKPVTILLLKGSLFHMLRSFE